MLEQRNMIDQAAGSLGKNRPGFMLDAARDKAAKSAVRSGPFSPQGGQIPRIQRPGGCAAHAQPRDRSPDRGRNALGGRGVNLGAPELLAQYHNLASFSCGEAVLNDWRKGRVFANQFSGPPATSWRLMLNRPWRLIYALAAGTVAHQAAARAIQGNKPDPLPLMVLARMAVGTRAQGIKLAAALRQNAVNRAMTVSQNAALSSLPQPIR